MARRQFRRPPNSQPAAPAPLLPGQKPGETLTADNPALTPPEPVDEVTLEAVAHPPKISREPTLAELNRQSWAIDDQHAAKRREAEEKINEVAAPLLAGVQRGRSRLRRLQKPIRPLVR